MYRPEGVLQGLQRLKDVAHIHNLHDGERQALQLLKHSGQSQDVVLQLNFAGQSYRAQ